MLLLSDTFLAFAQRLMQLMEMLQTLCQSRGLGIHVVAFADCVTRKHVES